ncbi:MAG TPA: response regulator transcription factor, partial [Thermomicrobiales bacterium]|nr:response regulator transcription factor [Thermomicrobiales bacterium]
YARAIPLLRRFDDRQTLVSALTNAGSSDSGDWCSRIWVGRAPVVSISTNAETPMLEALDIARAMEWRSGESYALGAAGIRAAQRGHLRAGLQQLHDSLAVATDITHHMWTVQAHFRLGVAHLYLLDSGRALAYLQPAFEITIAMSSRYSETSTRGCMASAHVLLSEFDIAEELLRGQVDVHGSPLLISAKSCWFAAAELRLAQGRPDEALEIIDRLIESIPNSRGNLSADLSRLRGEILLALGKLGDAESELAAALETAIRRGYPHSRWQALAMLRRLYLTRGQQAEATRSGADARVIVDSLAEQLDDEDVRATFLRNADTLLSEAPPAGQRAVEIPAGLTAREIEVLGLVAEGLSDIEVGERLFISPRTVSQHLRSAYGKLDVNNRTAAVRAARELGVV